MGLNLTQATNGKSLASIGKAISTAAQSVTAAFNATTEAVSMADNLVQHSSRKQQDRYRIEQEEYRENLILEASSREAETGIKVEDFCAKSEKHAELFNRSYAKYSALFADSSKPSA